MYEAAIFRSAPVFYHGGGPYFSKITVAVNMDLDFSIELYDSRDLANRKCSILVVLCVIAFMFTYSVWWVCFFTILMALLGYWATSLPITKEKLQGIHCVCVIVDYNT